jgi:hypothetical protein
MTTKRRPAGGKKVPAKKSLFQRVSDAMNPRTYLEKPAQRTMSNANEQYGGGARRRRIDAEVDAASEGRPRTRRR